MMNTMWFLPSSVLWHVVHSARRSVLKLRSVLVLFCWRRTSCDRMELEGYLLNIKHFHKKFHIIISELHLLSFISIPN